MQASRSRISIDSRMPVWTWVMTKALDKRKSIFNPMRSILRLLNGRTAQIAIGMDLLDMDETYEVPNFELTRNSKSSEVLIAALRTARNVRWSWWLAFSSEILLIGVVGLLPISPGSDCVCCAWFEHKNLMFGNIAFSTKPSKCSGKSNGK